MYCWMLRQELRSLLPSDLAGADWPNLISPVQKVFLSFHSRLEKRLLA